MKKLFVGTLVALSLVALVTTGCAPVKPSYTLSSDSSSYTLSINAGMSTHGMIVKSRAWLAQQGASNPRDTLTQIRDMCVYLLLPDNPPSNVPNIGTLDWKQSVLMSLGDIWLSIQEHLTPEQFLTQLRDGAKMYLNALPAPTPVPVPVPVPTPTPTPTPVPPTPVVGDWHGCMFVPATPGLPNNHGVRSQLDYRGIHNQSGEFVQRSDMPVTIQRWGGNMLVYIRGEFDRGNPVLDMVLNGMRHPDGHYFPIKAPTASAGEVDLASWMKQTYGIVHHLCWVWNDNTSTPFTESVVDEAVKSYYGTRLGIENVAFGVCLESDENMSADLVVSACGWIHTAAPTSPVIVGSANEGFLQQVGARVPYALLWLEQASNPVMLPRGLRDAPQKGLRVSRALKAPLTPSTFPAYLASLNSLAAKFGKGRVIPGEWWASSPADVASMTRQLQAAGFTFFGSGKYN